MFSEDRNKKEEVTDFEPEGASESPVDRNNTPSADLNSEIELCKEQMHEWRDKYLHLNADFQNYKRRQEKERGLWMHSAQAQILKELLTIVGDFDRALAQQPGAAASEEQWRQGFEMIRASLYKLLAKFEVTEITQTSEFDPEIHEAIAMVESPDRPSGSIVDVVEKGFMFKGQVLRPAKVTVAQ